MVHLNEYIIEAINKNLLNQKTKQFFLNIQKNYDELISNKTLNKLDVNIKQLNKPDAPFILEDFRDKSILNIIKDTTYGFNISKSAIVSPDNYLGYNDISETRVFPYFYKDGKNTYFVGIVAFTASPTHIDNYMNLVIIETSNLVKNNDEVIGAMYNDIKQYVKANSTDNCLGFASKPTETIYKNNIQQTSMKKSDINQEIYIDKF